MNALKEPERINLAEGLTLLESHLPAEEAKTRLRNAFTQKGASLSRPAHTFSTSPGSCIWATAVRVARGVRHGTASLLWIGGPNRL